MNVALIGYRGSGKSSVAAPLAAGLGWTTVDADAELERAAGMSIREIFAAHGEPWFRALERETLLRLLQNDRQVVSAGGGAVLDANNRRDLRAAGPVVWLRASVDTLLRRIAEDRTTAARRPNLTAAGGRQEVEELLARREPLYRDCATHVVDTDGRSPDDIAAEILALLAPLVGGGGDR